MGGALDLGQVGSLTWRLQLVWSYLFSGEKLALGSEKTPGKEELVVVFRSNSVWKSKLSSSSSTTAALSSGKNGSTGSKPIILRTWYKRPTSNIPHV